MLLPIAQKYRKQIKAGNKIQDSIFCISED